jgi:hypothetical protein
MATRNEIFEYLVKEYYGGSTSKVSKATNFSVQQIKSWIDGKTQPQKDTIEYLIHKIFTPEFQAIFEFEEFNPEKETRAQLRNLFKGHEKKSGIYSFYDSMANLLYLGKAANLLEETISAIQRPVQVSFPKELKIKPQKRTQVVRYVSAYDVGESNWVDFPKHVESLILRISKPPLNKNIGSLAKAYPSPPKSN